MAYAAHPTRSFDFDDLLALPDDGLRYEVIDGALVVNAAPSWRHQRIADRLVRVLAAAAPAGVEVISAPAWRIEPGQVPEPDVVVVERTALGDYAVEGTPLLVIEVLSQNRGMDLVRKRELYARAGCRSYWVVDPDVPSVIVLRLVDGSYAEVAAIAGTECVELAEPFPVTISPAVLVAD